MRPGYRKVRTHCTRCAQDTGMVILHRDSHPEEIERKTQRLCARCRDALYRDSLSRIDKKEEGG
jgi:hypothetical protein